MPNMDPSIYQNAFKPTVALQDPMDSMGKAMQMKHAMQQQEMGDLQLQQQKLAATQSAAFRQDVQDAGGDLGKLKSAHLKHNKVKEWSEIEKAQREAQAAAAKLTEAQGNLFANVGGAVLQAHESGNTEAAQSAWESGKKQAQSMGMDTSTMPQQYDPKMAAGYYHIGVSAVERYKVGEDSKKVTGFHPLEDGTVVGLTKQGEAKQILKDGVPVMAPKKEPLVQVNAGEKEAFKNETTLRKEYNSEIGSFKVVKDSMRRINVSEQNNTAGSDLNLIYAYMKMLDPNSAVKEGEFATAANAASLPNRLVAQYNKIVSGERLSPETKADFIKQANQIYEQALAGQKAVAGRYRGIAQKYGLDPASVVTDEDTKPALTKLHTNGKQTIGWNGSKWVDATTGQEVK